MADKKLIKWGGAAILTMAGLGIGFNAFGLVGLSLPAFWLGAGAAYLAFKY